jgi:hypothetical protein
MENVKKMIDSLSSKFSYIFHFLKKRIHIKINVDSFLEHIIVLELYTLLTILAFHKLFILGIDKVLIGDGGDAYQFLWNFWWIKKAILEGRDIFYTDYLFYPKGTHLYSHTLTLTYSLLAFLIQFVTNNLFLIYNFLVLFSFIIASYSTFLLAKHVTKNLLLSILAGIYFGFSSYMYSKALGQLNLCATFIFPLLFLWLIKLVEEENRKKVYLISTKIFLLLIFTFFTDLYYFSFSLIIVVLFVFLLMLKKQVDKVGTILLLLLSFFSILSPIIIKYLYHVKHCENCYTNLQDILKPSSPFNYFSFSPFSAFEVINSYLRLNPVYNFSYADSVISFPMSLLIPFFLVFLLSLKKKILLNEKEKKIVFCFSFIFFLFFILSLGPSDPIFHLKNIFFYLYHLFFPYIRVSTRLAIVSLLASIIVFIVMFNKIANKNKNYTTGVILFLIILAYIESFPYKFYFITFSSPPYQIIEMIKNDEDNITILNIPPEWANSFSMYLQTIHEKKMLDGYISRRENESLYSIVKLKTFIREEDVIRLISFLKEQNTRYIIYYKFLRGEAYSNEFSKILSLLPQKNQKVVYNDTNYLIIRIEY